MGTYTYSRTFQTSEMVRLTCDGFRGDFKSINWNNSGYSTSGDDVALVLPSTVTITMQKVTATWFNNAGGCSYKFYIKLYTPDGTFQSSTKTYEWPAGGGTNTISFDITGVTGAWTRFEVWGQNWTMSEKKTEYPYVYWFNNSAGTVTVKYVTETSTDGAGLMVGEDGKWKGGKYYVWKTIHPTTYIYPEAAMTAYSSQNCTVSASSEVNTNDRAWKAFDKTIGGYPWSSKNSTNDPEPWLQIIYPKKLFNIELHMWNRAYDTSAIGPISGSIYGSEDGGATLVQIGSYNNRPSTKSAITHHICSNTSTAYQTIRIQIDSWYNTSGTVITSGANIDVGEIRILGAMYP